MKSRKITVVIPEEMHSRLVELASQQCRSLQGQVVYMLSRGIEAQTWDGSASLVLAAQSAATATTDEMSSTLLHYLLSRAVQYMGDTALCPATWSAPWGRWLQKR